VIALTNQSSQTGNILFSQVVPRKDLQSVEIVSFPIRKSLMKRALTALAIIICFAAPRMVVASHSPPEKTSAFLLTAQIDPRSMTPDSAGGKTGPSGGSNDRAQESLTLLP
jgi:hypothetical protein